jgi:hypothetical protein
MPNLLIHPSVRFNFCPMLAGRTQRGQWKFCGENFAVADASRNAVAATLDSVRE